MCSFKGRLTMNAVLVFEKALKPIVINDKNVRLQQVWVFEVLEGDGDDVRKVEIDAKSRNHLATV